MPIKTVQNTGLTATSLIQNSAHGVKGGPLTHQELDVNFRSMWPLGSIYINVAESANPRDLIGFGVWKSLGKQTILVGVNANHAHDTVTLSVADGSGFRGDELVAGGTSEAKGRIHRFISTNEFVVEPLIEGSAFQESETITGEDSGASTTINVGGVGASLTNTNQGLSSKLSAVSVLKNQGQNICNLVISTSAAHKFAKGQRVTLSGITGNTGNVNPNREREIIDVLSTTQFVVDYRSPRENNLVALGRDETLSVSGGASASLFGQRYDENIPARAESVPFAGTGGQNTAKLGPLEIPAHTHNINWSFVDSLPSVSLLGSRRGGYATSAIGDGANGFRDPQWGFINPSFPGRWSDSWNRAGYQDDARLAPRGYNPSTDYSVKGFDTAREAHNNIMPFIAAYFWVRIPDSPNYVANGGL